MGKRHQFSVELAQEVGILGAVICEWFLYWMYQNRTRMENMHDDKIWIYTSLDNLVKLYPYASRSAVHETLVKLTDSGFVIMGDFNKKRSDRTKWYTITDKTMKILGESPYPDSGQAYPDSGHAQREKSPHTPLKENNTLNETPYSPPLQGDVCGREENNKKKVPLISTKPAAESFLHQWNSLAACYGYTCCKIMPENLIGKINKLNTELSKTLGVSGYETFWNNVRETMQSYCGCDFTKYFTISYILRPEKRILLMQDKISNVPQRLDPVIVARAHKALKTSIKFLSDRLHNVIATKGTGVFRERTIANLENELKELRRTLSSISKDGGNTGESTWSFVRD